MFKIVNLFFTVPTLKRTYLACYFSEIKQFGLTGKKNLNKIYYCFDLLNFVDSFAA